MQTCLTLVHKFISEFSMSYNTNNDVEDIIDINDQENVKQNIACDLSWLHVMC